MTEPILEEQLLSLSPATKVVVGLALALGGAVGCVLLWERGWIAGAAVFALVMGPTLAFTGRRELARERAFHAELARARDEWPELERGVESARRQGRSVARYLQARGYREYAVRRWIAGELDPDAGQG